jgi:putative glutathione S-transferase
MGVLINGVWHEEREQDRSRNESFVRPLTQFRDIIQVGGQFQAEPGRYHLYVSRACPWAHRTLVYRKLKGLENVIGVSYVEPLMLENGWTFRVGADPVNEAQFLWEIYVKSQPRYTGKATVPLLWDCARKRIVNNESSDIIRIFDTWPGAERPLLRPPELASEIDALNDGIYDTINNGVYRAGFAVTQAAYDEAFDLLFATLDTLEERLTRQNFLLGETPTEPDWRLFTTLVRFDAAYHGHFKCNRNRLVDFPALWDYTRALYQVPGIAETVRLDEIKKHYYGSHHAINPAGVVPKGPAIDFTQATERAFTSLTIRG